MRILVTGGAGLIGSHYCAKLVQLGHEVVALDSFRFTYGFEAAGDHARNVNYRLHVLLRGAQVVQCCLSEKRRLAEVVDTFRPEAVVHLASIPLVGYLTTHYEEAAASLSQGLINLLEIVRAQPSVERFVYVSSSMVYGHFLSDPVEEESPLDPISVYGGLKLAGEVLTRAYLKGTSASACVIRPSCVYGPTDTHERVVRKFCRAAMTGGSIQLTDASDQLIDLTYVDDAANGLVLAATHQRAGGETFNLSFGHGRRLSELADLLESLYPALKRDGVLSGHDDRPRRGTLSIDRARRLLGYEPVWTMEAAIPVYLRWLGSFGEADERAAA